MSNLRNDYKVTPALSEKVIKELTQALSKLRFGEITLIVQDGRVIQIEKTEKIRLTKPGHQQQE
jgi:hypothetical protein